MATFISTIDGKKLTASERSPTVLGTIDQLTVGDSSATWEYPDAGLELRLDTAERPGAIVLSAHSIGAGSAQELTWPVSSTDSTVESIEYANGSGLTIPIHDTFWLGEGAGLVGSELSLAGDVTLPIWGFTGIDHNIGVGMYTTTDIGTTLNFTENAGSVQTSVRHSFSAATPDFTVTLTPNTGSQIASAVDYRRYLDSTGAVVTLDEKISANPEVGKLIGAPHAYVWGTGREEGMINALTGLGVDRFWLGYDSGGYVPDASFVSANDQYLVGPYDSWANAQDPETSDAPSSTWPEALWPNGCVIDSEGDAVEGFGGRGCYLSSSALAQAQTSAHVLNERVSEYTTNGATSYFLDVDAAGQLFEDFSTEHPQSKEEDRELRLERMGALAAGNLNGGDPLVVGSESAGAWANPAISFSHGSSTPTFNDLWKVERDRENWGGYWPEERPGIYFKPAVLPDDLATAMFAPQYRVPLYESVLHDSVVSTDRWELGLYKLPELKTQRILTSMLYNEPIMYSLDASVVSENGGEIATLQSFFTKIQEAAGTSPLTDFQTLSRDALVQQTTFGDGQLSIVANFSSSASHGVNPGCVSATFAGGTVETLCP